MEEEKELEHEEKKQEEGKKSHVLINVFIILVIAIISVYLYARYTEHSQLVMNEYRVASDEIPSNFSGIKIVHFSDLYFGNTTDIKEVDNLVEKINIVKPDIVIFSGNLYGNRIKKQNELKSSLKKIDAKLGKYAVKGNNDYNEEYESFMKDIDFKVLNNEYELIYNNDLTPIYLCGLSSSLKEEVNLENCLKYFNEDTENLYKIYVIHEGDPSKKIIESSNANVVLSGNSLGGLIKVPFYGPIFIPNGSKKYNGEYYKYSNSEIFISNGIGTNDKPYRFLNKPSFNLYRLKSLK